MVHDNKAIKKEKEEEEIEIDMNRVFYRAEKADGGRQKWLRKKRIITCECIRREILGRSVTQENTRSVLRTEKNRDY